MSFFQGSFLRSTACNDVFSYMVRCSIASSIVLYLYQQATYRKVLSTPTCITILSTGNMNEQLSRPVCLALLYPSRIAWIVGAFQALSRVFYDNHCHRLNALNAPLAWYGQCNRRCSSCLSITNE